ncbi:hypothetical protein EJ04DRAFT_505307 [Polyplosphaeria fusca]|uniref:Uncharacterized protein n=1 Tax=Polyplosphaeria fusca TaxID=682080 RepID=A0A9P4QJN3_9PLEO|nr:hypothetical protein EJ04DRAFT_505307 [Polyplosphaeria fusca]
MASLGVREAAIFSGVGVAVMGLLIWLIVLLVRAVRRHKVLLADLEARGVAIAEAQAQNSKLGPARPRAVLRRNTILPFNDKAGWDTLQSRESINPPEPPSIPPHYAPPKPVSFGSKSSRLSWPFSARKGSGKAIHLRKIRLPILSTVIESPKPSPLIPILNGPLGSDPASPRKSHSRPSSDQSLLQHHPIFRKDWQDGQATDTSTETRVRPNRSRSVAEIPLATSNEDVPYLPRPSLHARSASICSQGSGNAPEAQLPPLPLEVARLKTQERRRSLLSRSPSRFSVSSRESAGSSILATQSSPSPHLNSTRVQKVSKRNWRNSLIVGPRPLRDTLSLHGRHQTSPGSIKSSAARFSSVTTTDQQSQRNRQSPTTTASSSIQSIKLKTAEAITLSKVASPSGSSFVVRDANSSRRQSGSSVTAYGSPQERRKAYSLPHDISGNLGGPSRQLSQASSTRSSNGNPFQWDPAPLSCGKPSALKGSPSARKNGHKRKNCVRISLDPIYLGPPSRSPSPAIHDIEEESPTSEKSSAIGLDFSSKRSLPRPPSVSVFAPDVKLNATSIRASLTPSSPTLSMANFDRGPKESSFSNSLQIGPIEPSSPFEVVIPDYSSDIQQPLLVEYDPDHPYYAYHTPASSPKDYFSSPFSMIPEESSVISNQTMEYERLQSNDSPPCSPKTLRPHPLLETHIPLTTSIQHSTIPEEPLSDTIDPAILSKSAFGTLNSSYEQKTNIFQTARNTRSIMPIPTSPSAANSLMEPLLEAAFPSSPPVYDSAPVSPMTMPNRSRTPEQFGPEVPLQSAQSSPTSIYSACPSPSSSPPCSPRPAHAQLPNPTPTPTINFSEMPSLPPSLTGPRINPPRPLRSSIQKLRRWNSDARKGGEQKDGKGERRYLKLGREDSIALPGEESWLDELEPSEVEELDEDKGRMLVGTVLDDWEEEATVLDIQDEHNTAIVKPSAPIVPPVETKGVENHAKPPQSSPKDRSSSIWEDGEKFWHSTPPHRNPTSPNKPKNRFQPLSSSPPPSRKRDFEVAKDITPASECTSEKSTVRRAMAQSRYRKRRSALGLGTPNVNRKICVEPPSGEGRLYDDNGFLLSDF